MGGERSRSRRGHARSLDRSVSASRSRSRCRSWSRGRTSSRGERRKVIHVPSEFAGTLIGKGGETINNLSRETGARIEVSKDERDCDRTVTLSGSSDAVDRGVKAVEEVIARARDRLQGRSSDAPAAAATTEEKKTIHVPQEYVGMLIGKGGEKIKTMTRESGARIEVSRDEGELDRTVTLSGAPESIRKASFLVDEVIKRAREMFTTMESESEEEPLPTPPPGFQECGQEAYLHNPSKNAFFERTSGRICWLDTATGEYHDLHQGESLDLSFAPSAATRLGACEGAATASSGAIVKPAPKHVVIPDLHRAAQALKASLDHLDRPCAMLGVFGHGGGSGVPVDIAARGLHEKLIKRLAASRSRWPDEALFGALTGSLFDIAAGHGGVQPVAALALVVGRRVTAVAAPGTSLCLITGESSNSAVPSDNVVAAGAMTCFEELDPEGDSTTATVCIALSAGETQLDEGEMMLAASPHLYSGRPRAASVALLKAACARGATDRLAAACARLCGRGALGARPRVRPEDLAAAAVRKVRVSQILLRHWPGKGPQPMDPVRKRSVCRTLEEAEAQLLEVLEGLVADGCAGFRNACKSMSECQSALKGGGLEGDLGWLDQAKDAALKKAKGEPGNPRSVVKAAVPSPVLKAAFELEVGELSDFVHSELGVHLLLRTA